VGHNTSKQKRKEIEQNRIVAELSQWLVPGWRVDRNRLQIVTVDTVLGHFQRGQEVLLRCRKRGCFRRVEVDLRSAIEEGHADKSLRDLIAILRCGHWCGCEIEEVHALYPDGVPLVSYLNHPDVLIAVTCEHCGTRLLLPPRQMIARLKKAGRGGGSTGVLKLGTVVRGPCRKCGTSLFRSETVWPKQPGNR
jgi:hypothetical protein